MPSLRQNESKLAFAGLALTLLMPLFLTHGRALAEISLSVIALLFLLNCLITNEWGWLRQGWVVAALVWWGWQLLCTLPPVGETGTPALVQAGLTMRFIIFIAALQNWTLQSQHARTCMKWLLSICTVYIAAQILFQAGYGVNFFGAPRAPDGTLTGPYTHSRAAAPLSRLIPPVLMLAISALACKKRAAPVLCGILLTVTAIGTLALAGQRMPMALTLFGVLICALLYRPYRLIGLLSVFSSPAILYVVKHVSHRSTDHLVTLAQQQLGQFSQSHYGLIYGRVWAMVSAHPLTGLGYDAFRHECRNPAFFRGVTSLGQPADGGGALICVQHAHNHFAQMLSNAGWLGLLTFVLMISTILLALWPRSGKDYAWRTGLCVAFILQEWPIASSSDFTNMPLGGWAFLLIGVGLAEARANARDRASDDTLDQPPDIRREPQDTPENLGVKHV